MKKTFNKPSMKLEKNSILVLIAAAIIFIAAFLYIHSEDILNGAGSIFWVYGNDQVAFERATVTEIISENKKVDEVADGAFAGEQQLNVIVKSGRYKGESMVVDNYFGPDYGNPVAKGDGVILTIKTLEDGKHTATVYEYNRIPLLAGLLLIFFVLIVLIGGRTGLKSLAGLIFTFICLFMILIPLLLKGAPTVLTTFLVCIYIALVSFTILGGVHRKTISAFLGTASGAFFAMIFGMAAQNLAKINGLRLEDAEPLLQLKYKGGIPVGVKGLLTAGIIISALGAVMDVAMSISSALEEIHAAKPSVTRKELFRSGMNIGRDMVGTMTNTLILAFLGSEFTLMIFLYSRELTFYHMFSTALVTLETISGLASSIGMILSIPLTVFISSSLITRRR